MRILVTGSLKGSTERLKGLVDVSQPDLLIVIGPLLLSEPLDLGVRWFFVRGSGDDLSILGRCNGVDILSRIFKFRETFTFSGISGIYHPATARLTRSEWMRVRKLDKRSANYIFKDDIDAVVRAFKNLGIEGLDALVLADSPEKPIFKEVLELVNPEFVFFPSARYLKEKRGRTTFVGLEEISSPRGKYLLNL